MGNQLTTKPPTTKPQTTGPVTTEQDLIMNMLTTEQDLIMNMLTLKACPSQPGGPTRGPADIIDIIL